MPDGDVTLSLHDEIVRGLSQPQKTLPAKLFYDDEGCRLFGEITRLPEYYVTRTERAVLNQALPDLPHRPGTVLVEYGGSDEAKAALLFDQVGATTYVPIDIAAPALADIVRRLGVERPGLDVRPIATDFLQPLVLPTDQRKRPVFGFFPGSTIGNLDPDAARTFLRQARSTLGHGSHLLIGVDLRKDPAILLPAYDDAQGVTARFNLNILRHVNNAIGSGFEPTTFAHRADWNDEHGRIEMHLVSMLDQIVVLPGCTIQFSRGETIHTENSYKHTVDGFVGLAEPAGWRSARVWTDEAKLFSLHLLDAGVPAP